jgi:hypothetical protein
MEMNYKHQKYIYNKNSQFLFNHFYERIYRMVFRGVKNNTFIFPNTKRLEGEIKRYIEDLINKSCCGLRVNIHFTNDIKIAITVEHQEASFILYNYDLEYYQKIKNRKKKIEKLI